MWPLYCDSPVCTVTFLSTVGYILRFPEKEDLQTNTGHDPFLLLCPRALHSKHQDMIMKLRKLCSTSQESTNGTCLLYISLLLVTLSHDVQLNPGPRPPKFPCGSCSKAVRHNQNSIQCDGCNIWYHIGCQGLNLTIHDILAEHSYSWTCLQCGLPNFSSAIFEESLTVLSNSSKYSALDQSLSPMTSTPIKKKAKPKPLNQIKVMNINFQSIVNKVSEFHCFIDTEKPDVVIGTESWLTPDISNNEIFPPGYTPYRADRSATTRGGGVFILVQNNIICTEQPQFKTECELIWVKLEVTGAHPLFIGAYYRPKEDDQPSLLELRRSVEEVRKHAKGNIWLLGDFNFPKLVWPENNPILKSDCSHKQVYELFLDFLDDFSFTQMTTDPTRQNNVLDLFLTTNPTLVQQVNCLPGLSDHDMVMANCCIKPSVLKPKPRKVQIFRKADWSKLKSLMADFRDRFINEHFRKSVEDLWNEFKTAIDQFSTQCIPTKLIRGKSSFPWITQEIRRMIRKRDHIYRRFKKTGAQETRIKFLQLRKEIKHKIKASYNLYLEGLLGLNDSNNDCDSKKLFTFLKNSRQDQLGSSPLKQNDNLVTDSSIKANIHNQQFQSVFTTKRTVIPVKTL